MIRAFFSATLRDRISIYWAFGITIIGILAGVFLMGVTPSYAFLYVVGLISLGNLSFGLMGAAFELQQQRQSDIFKVVQISRLGRSRYFMAFAASKLLFVMIFCTISLAIGMLAFQVTPSFYDIVWFAVLMVYLFVFGLLLGAAFSFVSSTPGNLATFTNLIMLLLVALSSLFYDTSILPDWLAAIADYLPIGIFIALREGGNFILNTIMLLVYLGLAVWLAKRTYTWSAE